MGAERDDKKPGSKPSLSFAKLNDSLKKFYADSARNCDEYEKNVFIMTRFLKGNKTLEAIDQTIRSTLSSRGLYGHRADDRCYPDDRNLWDNVCTYMHGCKYGVAVLEDILKNEFNPNVALEYGYMRALQKPVLLLKELRFQPRADILGTIWEEFDVLNIEESISSALSRWMDDLDSREVEMVQIGKTNFPRELEEARKFYHKDYMYKGPREIRVQVVFPTPFKKQVKDVVVSLQKIDLGDTICRLLVRAENVRLTGFELCFETWQDSKVYDAIASWVAVGE
jgi:hypothetical protein